MGDSFDVIVIGVGAMGSSACWHLARRGARVLGIEQFDIPHNLGSSHGMSRMIRMAYYEHPDYVPLLRRAYELWHELERLSGQRLLHITGGLYMGAAGSDVVTGATEAAQIHGLAHELLSRGQVAARFPQFELPPDHVGLFEPLAGFLLPEKVITAYARAAIESGAEIHGREAVREWSSDSTGVRVRTDRGEYHAAKLVLCAGPWTPTLLRDTGVKLTVTRQVLIWLQPRDPRDLHIGTMPVWGVDRLGGGLFYGFPLSPDDVGLKVALHAPAEPTDPDRVRRDPQPGDTDLILDFVAKHLPGGAGPLLSQRVCLYTNSPDSHFVIDMHPNHPNVALACGFSGHGFKFASVVGEVLADLTLDGSTKLPAQFLGLHRFRR